MPIRKRPSKKTKSGYTYQVYFPYVDSMGVRRDYFKGGFITKKDAQTHEAIKRNEIATYGDLYTNTSKTFNEVFEEFMDVEGYQSYSKSTIQYYMHSYTKHIKSSVGLSRLFNLKYRDIQKFFNGLQCGQSTAKNIKKIFNKTFSYAMKNGYIKENPMVYVKLQNKATERENKKVNVITKEELDRIIENMIIVDKHVPDYDYSQFNYYSYAVALLIGWYTGLRVSETCGLHKGDFDFENNTINIQRRLEYHSVKKDELYTVDKLKTKKSKSVIPLANKLKEILLLWFEKNPYEKVICDIYGNYILPGSMDARIRYICKKLDISFHYHCLRHSFTTNLIQNDVKPNITMELVRHSDISTTLGIYTHVKQSDKSEVIESVFGKE